MTNLTLVMKRSIDAFFSNFDDLVISIFIFTAVYMALTAFLVVSDVIPVNTFSIIFSYVLIFVIVNTTHIYNNYKR